MDKEKALKMLLKASQLKEEDIQSSKTTSEREYWNGVADGLTEAYNLIENFNTKEK